MCDPAIKLFGKTIALPSHTDQAGAGRAGGGGGVKGCTNNEKINTESKPNSEDKCDEPITSSTTTTSSTADRETQLQKPPPSAAAAADDDDDDHDHDDHHHHQEEEEEKDPKTDQEEEEQQQQQQQDEKPALKKPDKILPCPRCNSMDTKFCYYNNYNVNQPRHFCKNCQRYWTAGGTMRNVPVGAGRRKNKNAAAVAAAAAHYRHLTMTDAGPALKPKGTVLSFGSDMPLSESMASVLDLAEKSMTKKTCNRSNGFQRMEEHAEEQSTGSSATNSNSAADDEGNNGASLREPAGIRNCQGLAPHLLYIGSSSPWPYPWNLPPPTPPTSAPFCGSTFPIPIYPATAYWGGCSAWSIPWLAPLQGGSPSPTSTPPGCGPPNSTTTTTLGKHTREGNVLHRGSSAADTVVNEQSSQEKCLWIPKTLRIDDPEEAAKSSIWATMGFSKKNDKADGFSSLGGGLFRSFQTKTELWSRKVEASQALHVNPAALSRSIEFQES